LDPRFHGRFIAMGFRGSDHFASKQAIDENEISHRQPDAESPPGQSDRQVMMAMLAAT
jgi:hypothetical protein